MLDYKAIAPFGRWDLPKADMRFHAPVNSFKVQARYSASQDN